MIYLRLLTECGMLVFLTNLSLLEFQVKDLALFLLSSAIDDFGWFWMSGLHKNIQLILKFLEGSFLVLHYKLYYTFMTFLMMLSVILLSMLMIYGAIA